MAHCVEPVGLMGDFEFEEARIEYSLMRVLSPVSKLGVGIPGSPFKHLLSLNLTSCVTFNVG